MELTVSLTLKPILETKIFKYYLKVELTAL